MGPKMAPESAGKLFGGVMGKPWARNDPFLGLFWAHFGPYPAPPFGTYLGMNQVVGAPKVVQKGVQNRPQNGPQKGSFLAHDPPGWPTPPK